MTTSCTLDAQYNARTTSEQTEIGQSEIDQTLSFKGDSTLVAGAFFSCILVKRQVRCTGASPWNGSVADSPSWIPVRDHQHNLLDDVHELYAAYDNACAIVGPDRTAYCWGSNNLRQLGNPDVTDALVHRAYPIRLGAFDTDPDLTGVTDIGIGASHICAVDYTRRVYCSGSNNYGQAGRPIGLNVDFATPIESTVFEDQFSEIHKIRSALGRTCVLGRLASTNATQIYCWGNDQLGGLGNGTLFGSDHNPTPVILNTGSGYTFLTGIDDFTVMANMGCAYANQSDVSKVFCWGHLMHGLNLDLIPLISSAATTIDTILPPLSRLHAGGGRICAITETGDSQMYCWGKQEFGTTNFNNLLPTNQAPEGCATFNCITTPALAKDRDEGLPFERIRGVALGTEHGCFLQDFDSQEVVQCFGYNTFGQFGNGRYGTRTDPSPGSIDPHLSTVRIGHFY